jgi:hypothetical protein
MSTYTPANLYNSSPFQASVVNRNFTKLSDVLNSNVGDYASLESNIRNDRLSLDFSSFRRNSVTESFRSPDLRSGSASGAEAYIVVIPGATPIVPMPWGVWGNSYDSVGTGLRFYLRDTADVQFASQINLVRAKTSHTFGSAPKGNVADAVLEVTAKLMIDGVAEKTIERDLFLKQGSGPLNAIKYRGLSICFNHIEEGMGIGAHTAHVNLEFGFSLIGGASVATSYSIIQIKGSGGTTCATAFYK